MDVFLLTFAALLITILIIVCTIILRYLSGTERNKINAPEEVAQRPLIRRAGVRNARFRMHMNNQLNEEDDGAENENNDVVKTELPDYKIGTKKRAKLAAKAEKKLHREAVERDREERKRQDQLLQERRDKEAEKEQAEKLRSEEAEKKFREEKEKKDYEEYLKMKESFNIEEEGCEEESEKNEQNLLQEFIEYIKQNKVLVLEDLAAHFSMKTSNVVERIQDLQANDTLTGVIDDRGKFIYISENELSTVAKFVRQRGRVTIAELAENSNNLINLASAKNLVSIN